MRFKEFICEGSTNCDQEFGKYLFGTFRNKGEPDTVTEKSMFQTIEMFIRGASMRKEKKDLLAKLEELAKCKDKYKDILVPSGRTLYRGSKMDWNIIKKLSFKASPFGYKGTDFVEATNVTYQSKAHVQSWTEDVTIALIFAYEEGEGWNIDMKAVVKRWDKLREEDEIPVVYQIDPSKHKNELIFNTDFTNYLGSHNLGSDESEVIRFSESSTYKVEKVLLPTDIALIYGLLK
jgi:hypothetical protein